MDRTETAPRNPVASRACLGFTSVTLAAGVLSLLLLSGCGGGKTGDTIKVGILHSTTGTMAISETSLIDAEKLAIKEINAAGGVLGKQIEFVEEDGASEFNTVFPEKATKLLLSDKVVAVFGCWTSASRQAVLPVFEKNNGLLFYPVQYEGNESSKNIVYAGAAPNQQIIPAVEWLLSKEGGAKKKFYLLGSDYVFPRTANLIIIKYLESKGLKVIGEKYTPLGHLDYANIVQDIKKADPDVIFSTINGGSNINFYKELAAQGLTADKVPVVAVSVGEDELRGLEPKVVKGHLAAWNYFQSLPNAKNKEFVEKFKKAYGEERVTDDPIEAAYLQVYLWKLAVEKAKSTAVDDVRKAFASGIEFDAPGGPVKLDPKNQHISKRFHMGRIRDDKQFDVIFSTPLIEPDPYPQIAFPGWSVDWTKDGIKKGKAVKIGG